MIKMLNKYIFTSGFRFLDLMLYLGVTDWLFVVMFLTDIWRQYLHIPVGHALVNHVYIVVALRYVRASYNKLNWLKWKWSVDLFASIELKGQGISVVKYVYGQTLFFTVLPWKCISYDKNSGNTVTLFYFGTCMWRLLD